MKNYAIVLSSILIILICIFLLFGHNKVSVSNPESVSLRYYYQDINIEQTLSQKDTDIVIQILNKKSYITKSKWESFLVAFLKMFQLKLTTIIMK